MDKDQTWYGGGKNFWQKKSSTVHGMIGGYSRIAKTDLSTSRRFILKTIKTCSKETQFGRALDCGAGIGRVTKGVLLPLFDVVDLVDQNEEFLHTAKARLSPVVTDKHRLGETYACGLQDFNPESAKYDVIWCQWVLSHLTDDDLSSFLLRCKGALRRNGIIFAKENVSRNDKPEIDNDDCSVARAEQSYEELFRKSGFLILKQQYQGNFPRKLLPVKLYALVPS
ncbi:N-terminal Xaa-Pro-Lys N-methyltransferase 1-B [Trichoplax sp. H2]|uniref:Alpha N-terminal protein methyltransferase 1 n=1 Tax=Trichoplax adhaerens TaxID=10228 RepID=B3RL31_TRIAD|nr:hypothetical protein TRIADDRAFT_18419 [Trichoplax adhaerens]EDV28690.1 hypothetical protein TRIADDRAFT_18419 [Trichoplax adhaerens]RDD44979.1 N-terminal Xaa-Pro-Lys N-methyltransferase 1-B [Trichoplax sp. H2]|eukprot:XP_002107892.1 hypothetical protein TRIADDRAFT_18419 [Trichoplax adhaerens]